MQFWTQNVRNWTETLTSDMSGPAKASPGGEVLVSKAGFYFLSQKLHLSCSYYLNHSFKSKFLNPKVNLWLSNKISCFLKQIYDVLSKSMCFFCTTKTSTYWSCSFLFSLNYAFPVLEANSLLSITSWIMIYVRKSLLLNTRKKHLYC